MKTVVHHLSGLPRKVCVAGAAGLVRKGNPKVVPPPPKVLIKSVLLQALGECELTLQEIDGLIAVPSLYDSHFMEAHYQATCLGLFGSESGSKSIRCRTIDTGGAGPVSALLEGRRMIENEGCEVVAVVAGDCVGSMDGESFLKKADETCQNPDRPLASPVIPHGYSKVTEYQIREGLTDRDDFRLVPCVESIHACRNTPNMGSSAGGSNAFARTYSALNESLTQRITTLEEVRAARDVTPNISLLECARRADGAAAIILASNRFLVRHGILRTESIESRGRFPILIGSGEASGPLFPPENITESMFSCEDACRFAYEESTLAPEDIDFFGLYDCFPVCLVRALEAAGLVDKGKGGKFLRECYEQYHQSSGDDDGEVYQRFLRQFPVNTHGGLLCYGAPWEVPAAFNIIEGVNQLRGAANPEYHLGERQIEHCRRALVYGNGGIFSASAVAIMGNGRL